MTDYTNIPGWLVRDLWDGKITNKMFNVMVWLLARANFKTGIVRMVSASRIQREQWADDREDGRPSERTIQEIIYRLDQCRYIKSHHQQGVRGSYAVTINNYSAVKRGEDGAPTEVLLNPTETLDWHELPRTRGGDKHDGFCDDASGEATCDASGGASGEASSYTPISPVSSLSPRSSLSRETNNQPTDQLKANAPNGATPKAKLGSGSLLSIFDDGWDTAAGICDPEEKQAWTFQRLVECFPSYEYRHIREKLTLDDWRQMYEVCKECEDNCCFAYEVLEYARDHNTSQDRQGLVPRSIGAFWNALCKPDVSLTNGLMAQFNACRREPCKKCVAANRENKK